jgi:hypothetical protein
MREAAEVGKCPVFSLKAEQCCYGIELFVLTRGRILGYFG